jgi:predicted dehydrogenase
MQKIKFAIVGFGHIGKRHAQIIQADPDAELVAVADVNLSENAIAREKFAVPFFYSAEDLFAARVNADVVCICTPNGFHARHAVMALQNGYHVVCEKPMGFQNWNVKK